MSPTEPDPVVESATTTEGKRRSWPSRVLSGAMVTTIRGYQRYISPLSGPSCRYYPTCSAYGVKALQVHGPIKGALLTLWRILRCNPFTKGGVDPVPRRGYWRPDVFPNGKPRPGRPVTNESGAAVAAPHDIGHNGIVDSVSTSTPVHDKDVVATPQDPAPPVEPTLNTDRPASTDRRQEHA